MSADLFRRQQVDQLRDAERENGVHVVLKLPRFQHRVHVRRTHRRPATVEVGVEIVIRNREHPLAGIRLIVRFQLGGGLKPQGRLAAPFLAEHQRRRRIGRTAKKLVPRRMVDRRQTEPFEHGVRLGILLAERIPGNSMVSQETVPASSLAVPFLKFVRPVTIGPCIVSGPSHGQRARYPISFRLTQFGHRPQSEAVDGRRRLARTMRREPTATRNHGSSRMRRASWDVASRPTVAGLITLLPALGCGDPVPARASGDVRRNRARRPAADRGGQRPPVGTAEAGRPISSEDRHRVVDHVRSVGPTGRADQAGCALRCLSVRQRDIRARPGGWRVRSSPTPCIATHADRWSWRCTTHSARQVQSLDDLTRPEVKKIALANPAIAPYGKAGKQALERAGLWDQLQPKIVIAESVRQALLYAQKGDAEAALVGRAIANVPEVRAGRGRRQALRPDHSGTRHRGGHDAQSPTPNSSFGSCWMPRDKGS